jgi:peptide/nickel transport system permease protein
MIGRALPVTLVLNGISLFFVYAITLPLGIMTAVKRGSALDRGAMVTVFILYSIPNFWAALLLMLAFSVKLDWLPLGGLVSAELLGMSIWETLGDRARHLILPVICLTYGGLAFLSRFARTATLEVINQDYIRTARAKGLAERVVIFKHTLRNALIPIVTILGMLLPSLIGGSVIIEQIFSLPGMGRLFFESILRRDYPVAMALSTISALLTLVSLLIMDLVYVWVDPRISFERSPE